MNSPDDNLLLRVRQRDPQAWAELIARYEGRLLAFAESRLGNQATAEDVVQETFLGFLLSLPNYDATTPLESFLFAIAANKLIDVLRKQGRRPLLPLLLPADEDESGASAQEPVSPSRRASSLGRSQERRSTEEQVLASCLRELIATWHSRGDFERLKCLELLLVAGASNQEVAQRLKLSEQAVANHKQFVLQKLQAAATKARLTEVDWSRHGLG